MNLLISLVADIICNTVNRTPPTFLDITQCDIHHRGVFTRPDTAAVVVAMAGTILPAIRLIRSRSDVSMLYMLALRF